ncbi:MAG: FAD-dependent oxidoreductase [Victivallales bacterium]|nr:FAD-dependent oxidoreductase [Victivallales bacterium]
MSHKEVNLEKLNKHYELVVIGGGSAGIGAALAAARQGVDTLLIEKEKMLGGNSVVSGVNCWEPVAGATGIPYDIYNLHIAFLRNFPANFAYYLRIKKKNINRNHQQ